MRIVMHIDVNNAFLSWSALYLLEHGSKYDIRNSYAVIGGDEEARRGIVLAKSMPAKKLGIKTGETLYKAREKCRVLKVYPSNFEYYKEMSKKLFELIRKYTPDIEIASIDECYLEYTNIKSLYGDEVEFACSLQSEIKDTLGFTVNIGIANNKLCAKMASDFTKPNKIHTLYDFEVKEKMWPLDVGDLFGIGKKSREKLIKLGINTIGDLANANPDTLYKYFKNQSRFMIDWANGIDNSKVNIEDRIPKGIGNEITLKNDISDKKLLYPYLYELSCKVGLRLRNEAKYAFVIAVTLKDKKFIRTSHQKKLLNPIYTDSDIFEYSKKVLNEMWKNQSVRLIGIRLEKLTDKLMIQSSLFENDKENIKNNLERTLDSINKKYKTRIVKKAREEVYNEQRDNKRNK
ncbi:MAG: DNA polymerase IV [Bacilli bacterium]|nr:DNA polymerase IV [Bacilli bacterium]